MRGSLSVMSLSRSISYTGSDASPFSRLPVATDNNDIVGTGSFTIFAGVAVVGPFFFCRLFFPRPVLQSDSVSHTRTHTLSLSKATVFGAGFFFDLFWPERHESRAVKQAWKYSAIFVTVCTFAACLSQTVRFFLPSPSAFPPLSFLARTL